MKKYLIAAVSFLTFTQLASAHATGHSGSFMEMASHYFSQWDHLAALLAVTALAGFVARKALSRRKKAK